MKPIIWIGIVLIVLGGLIFVYQGYPRDRNVVDVGSVHITTETHQRIPLSSLLGGLAFVGGAVLLVMGVSTKQ